MGDKWSRILDNLGAEREAARREVRAAAIRHGLNPDLLEAQAMQESSFNPRAGSPAGAQGVAQFMPKTGAMYGLSSQDRFNVPKAADAMARHMKDLLKMHNGNVDAALASYNAGPKYGKRVEAGRNDIPTETKNYVPSIKNYYDRLMKRSGSPDAPSAPKASIPDIAAPKREYRDTGWIDGRPGSADTQTRVESMRKPYEGPTDAPVAAGFELKESLPKPSVATVRVPSVAEAARTRVARQPGRNYVAEGAKALDAFGNAVLGGWRRPDSSMDRYEHAERQQAAARSTRAVSGSRMAGVFAPKGNVRPRTPLGQLPGADLVETPADRAVAAVAPPQRREIGLNARERGIPAPLRANETRPDWQDQAEVPDSLPANAMQPDWADSGMAAQRPGAAVGGVFGGARTAPADEPLLQSTRPNYQPTDPEMAARARRNAMYPELAPEGWTGPDYARKQREAAGWSRIKDIATGEQHPYAKLASILGEFTWTPPNLDAESRAINDRATDEQFDRSTLGRIGQVGAFLSNPTAAVGVFATDDAVRRIKENKAFEGAVGSLGPLENVGRGLINAPGQLAQGFSNNLVRSRQAIEANPNAPMPGAVDVIGHLANATGQAPAALGALMLGGPIAAELGGGEGLAGAIGLSGLEAASGRPYGAQHAETLDEYLGRVARAGTTGYAFPYATKALAPVVNPLVRGGEAAISKLGRFGQLIEPLAIPSRLGSGASMAAVGPVTAGLFGDPMPTVGQTVENVVTGIATGPEANRFRGVHPTLHPTDWATQAKEAVQANRKALAVSRLAPDSKITFADDLFVESGGLRGSRHIGTIEGTTGGLDPIVTVRLGSGRSQQFNLQDLVRRGVEPGANPDVIMEGTIAANLELERARATSEDVAPDPPTIEPGKALLPRPDGPPMEVEVEGYDSTDQAGRVYVKAKGWDAPLPLDMLWHPEGRPYGQPELDTEELMRTEQQRAEAESRRAAERDAARAARTPVEPQRTAGDARTYLVRDEDGRHAMVTVKGDQIVRADEVTNPKRSERYQTESAVEVSRDEMDGLVRPDQFADAGEAHRTQFVRDYDLARPLRGAAKETAPVVDVAGSTAAKQAAPTPNDVKRETLKPESITAGVESGNLVPYRDTAYLTDAPDVAARRNQTRLVDPQTNERLTFASPEAAEAFVNPSIVPRETVVPSPVEGSAAAPPTVPSRVPQPIAPETAASGEAGATVPVPPTVERRGGDRLTKEEFNALPEDEKWERRNTDTLTGLRNQTWFDAAHHLADADPNIGTLAFDGDNFGWVNKAKSQGHGDEALRRFGEAIKQAADENGLVESDRTGVARSGGDEFYVLGPKDILEKIRARAEELAGIEDVTGVDPGTPFIRTKPVGLTGSIGDTRAEAEGPLQAFKAAKKGQQEFVSDAPIDQIVVDPKRFQFRRAFNAKGGSGRLAGRKYNRDYMGTLTVWTDPADGKVYLVNGHHRLEKAVEAGETTVPMVRFLSPEVKTADEASKLGALENLSQGNAEPVEAAMFLRKSNYPLDVALEELAGTSDASTSIVKQAVELAKLNENVFGRVVDGTLSEPQGVAIGRHLAGNIDLQLQAMRLFATENAKGRKLKDSVVNEIAESMANGPATETVTHTLFGDEVESRSLVVERAGVSDYIRSEIGADKRAFGGAARNKGKLEAAGSKIADNARELADSATTALGVFDKEKKLSGPISEVLDDAARQIAEGKPAKQVRADAYDRIRPLLDEVLSTGSHTADATGKGRAGAGARVHESGLFDDSVGGAQGAPVRTFPRPTSGAETTLGFVASKIAKHGEDGTVSQALDSDGVEIINRLVADGIIAPDERPDYFNDDGSINQRAKDTVRDLVIADMFRDGAQLEQAPKSVKSTLERVTSRYQAVESNPDLAEWHIANDLRDAIDIVAEGKESDVSQYSETAKRLARVLSDNTPAAAAKQINDYYADVARARSETQQPPLAMAEGVEPRRVPSTLADHDLVVQGDKVLDVVPRGTAPKGWGEIESVVEAPPMANLLKAGQSHKLTVPKGTTDAPIIYVNAQTADTIQSIYDGRRSHWAGLSSIAAPQGGDAHRIAGELRNLAESLPKAQAYRARELADTLIAANDAALGGAGSFSIINTERRMADGSLRQRSTAEILAVAAHEQHHAVQRKLSMAWTGGKSSTEYIDPAFIESVPGLEPVLAKLNSSETYKDYQQSHLAMEVFTHLSTSPDVSVLGVNRKQATELLRHFYDAVYDRYGREGVERFVKINELAQGVRDAILEGTDTGKGERADARERQRASRGVLEGEGTGRGGGVREGGSGDGGPLAAAEGVGGPKEDLSPASLKAKYFGTGQEREGAKSYGREATSFGRSSAKAKRIDVAPIEGGTVKPLKKIISDFADSIDRVIAKTKQKPKFLGTYWPRDTHIGIRNAGDLDTVAHEGAHALDDMHGIVAEWAYDENSPFDKELIPQFSQHGSRPPAGMDDVEARAYERAEGVAEWVRAYIMNPEAALTAAPKFAKFFTLKIPAEHHAAVRAFSKDVREHAGLRPDRAIGASLLMKPPRPTVTEKVGFRKGAFEDFLLQFSDEVQPAIRNWYRSLEFRGQNLEEVAPRDNFELRARRLAGHDERFEDVYELGLKDPTRPVEIDPKTGRIIKANRISKGMKHVLDAASKESKAEGDRDLESAAEIGVAERQIYRTKVLAEEEQAKAVELTDRWRNRQQARLDKETKVREKAVEKDYNDRLRDATKARDKALAKATTDKGRQKATDLANRRIDEAARRYEADRTKHSEWLSKQEADLNARVGEFAEKAEKRGADRAWDRASHLTGIGAGLGHPTTRAQDAIAALEAAEPERAARVNEILRRFRDEHDATIEYLVKMEWIDEIEAARLRKERDFYVPWKRVRDEDTLADTRQTGGGGMHLSSRKQVIKGLKGGHDEIANPFISLLENMYERVKEADRHATMNAFVAPLRIERDMYQGPTINLAQFGFKLDAGPQEGSIPIRHKIVDENGDARVVEEHWMFPKETQESLKGIGEMDDGGLLWRAATLPGRIQRWGVVRGLGFMIRNPIRDPFQRVLMSEVGSKFFDSYKRFSADEKSAFREGGGQAGHFGVSKIDYDKRIDATMAKLRRDEKSIPFTLHDIWMAPERIGRFLEEQGRLAEFRKAIEVGTLKKGYDPQDAVIFATGKARGLLDYAIAGRFVKRLNQLIPFTNPQVQGLKKTAKLLQNAATDPRKAALLMARIAYTSILPELAAYAFNAGQGEEIEKKYWNQPAYLRDTFWNFHVADDIWIRIPKPFELGIPASFVGRAISWGRGDEHAFEGHGGQMFKMLMPVDPETAFGGGLGAISQMLNNRDQFRNQYIVDPNEEKLDIGLRKGTKNASALAQILQSLSGDNIDARQLDFLARAQFGGIGSQATGLSDAVAGEDGAGRKLGMSAGGLFVSSPGTAARDVQFVLKEAESKGESNADVVEKLREVKRAYNEAKTREDRERLSTALLDAAAEARQFYDANGSFLTEREQKSRDRNRGIREVREERRKTKLLSDYGVDEE